MRKRHTELKALVKKAIVDLLEKKQTKLCCDIFEVYLQEHVMKMRNSPADIKEVEDEHLHEMCNLLLKVREGDPQRVASIHETVASLCISDGFKKFNQMICGSIGEIYEETGLHSKAYIYFLRANNLPKVI